MRRRKSDEKNRDGERERETEKGGNERMVKVDVYNLSPPVAAAWVLICKKVVAHGIRISSRTHLNFNLSGAARCGHFSAQCSHPLGFLEPMGYLPAYLERPQVKSKKGCGGSRGSGRDKKKKKREHDRGAACPIKNRARLPGAEVPAYDERAHLIRAAPNVKSGAAKVFFPRVVLSDN